MVPLRVVQDLPDDPTAGLLVHDEERRPSRVGADADGVELGEVGLERLLPTGGVEARLCIQLTQLGPRATGSELYATEQ